MENESIDAVTSEYLAKDLKREDMYMFFAYVDILNTLLEIVIVVVGIERCKKILSSLVPEHEILHGSQITDAGKFIQPDGLAILEGHSEQFGLSIVLGGFNRLISEILEVYSSMSSFQLGTTVLISAASRAVKERAVMETILIAEQKKAEEFAALNNQLMASEQQLKASNQQLKANEQQLKASEQQLKAGNQQLRANEQLLLQTQEELKKKIADLELFQEVTIGREIMMVALKKEINQLLGELGREVKYEELT